MEPIFRTIVNHPQRLSELSKPDRALIDKLFDIKASLGRLIYPENPEIVKGYGPRDLVKDQKIIKVTNKVTYEEALFNGLRSRRPFQARESIDVVKEIKNTEDCLFCIPQAFYLTPGDVFLPGGRAEERSLQPPISRALMPTGRPWKPWR